MVSPVALEALNGLNFPHLLTRWNGGLHQIHVAMGCFVRVVDHLQRGLPGDSDVQVVFAVILDPGVKGAIVPGFPKVQDFSKGLASVV